MWPGVVAHYSDSDEPTDHHFHFGVPGGGKRALGGRSLRVGLMGSRIEEAHDGMGPLVGTEAVGLQAPADDWQSVKQIVLRRDDSRSGKQRPRRRLLPPNDSDYLSVADALTEMNAFWATALFYDHDDELIDSFDFRWTRAITKVEVRTAGVLPGPTGHEPPQILIDHEPMALLECIGPSGIGVADLRSRGACTCVTLAPRTLIGPARFRVTADGRRCEFRIDVDIVLWTVAPEDEEPGNWSDTPITIDRTLFRPSSKYAIWIRCPSVHPIGDLRLGPTWDRARALLHNSAECVPLREFGDLEEIRNTEQPLELSLWVSADCSATIVRVTAEPTQLGRQAQNDGSRPIVAVGRGRFRSATAGARVGTPGHVTINARPWFAYFENAPTRDREFIEGILQQPQVEALVNLYGISLQVAGSKSTTRRQPRAVAHAIARWCAILDPVLGRMLRRSGYWGCRSWSQLRGRTDATAGHAVDGVAGASR